MIEGSGASSWMTSCSGLDMVAGDSSQKADAQVMQTPEAGHLVVLLASLDGCGSVCFSLRFLQRSVA